MVDIAGKTNYNIPYINCLRVDVDGVEYCIDRNTTWYSWENGIMTMTWGGVYIWDGENEAEVPDWLLERATVKELEIEDDAPEGYKFELLDVYVNGEVIFDGNIQK